MTSEKDLGVLDENGEWVSYDDFKMDFMKAELYYQNYAINGKTGTNIEALNTYAQKDGESVMEFEDLFLINDSPTTKEQIDKIVETSKEKMDEGKQLVLSVVPSHDDKVHIKINDTILAANLPSGHAMYVTDVTEDSFIVASWGYECSIKFDELVGAEMLVVTSVDSK